MTEDRGAPRPERSLLGRILLERSLLGRFLPGRSLLASLTAVIALGLGSAACSSDTPHLSSAQGETNFDYEFVIPAGTEDRIDAGDDVEIVPAELEVKVGESIRIVNDDDTDHVVGVFFVPANSQLEQHFNSPGELIGDCDIHPSGTFSLTVRP